MGIEEAGVRQALLYPGEDGYWVAECPSLPGCVSQGRTRQEALANIKEAIEGYVPTSNGRSDCGLGGFRGRGLRSGG